MASGTLAAATLLYIHEIYLNPFQQGWMIHAEGLIRLLEVRGPERIQNDLDRSILCGQVGTIFLNAVQRRKHCFLAGEEWNDLLRRLTMSGRAAKGQENEAPSVVALSVYMPGLVCRFEELSATEDSAATWSLMEDILQIRVQLQHWRGYNDIESDRYDYDVEMLNASAAPMKSAVQMSTIVFLVLTGYMLVDLLWRHKPATPILEDDGSCISEMEAADLVEVCSKLALIAKIKWLAVKQTGREEAWASSTPNAIMLRRALKVPCAIDAKVNGLRPVMQDLYNCLSETE